MFSLEGRWLGFSNTDGVYTASDRLYQLSVSGRLAVSDRFRITASLPYSRLTRMIAKEQTEGMHGLGDASFLAEVQLLSSKKDSLVKNQNQLWLGLGLKAPTGEFRSSINSFYLPPNFQLGTGTWDGLASLSYRMRGSAWAWDNNVTGRTGGENKQAFSMPWLMIAQSSVKRLFSSKKTAFAVGLGAQGEFIGPTKSIDVLMEDGGYGLLGMLSANVQKRNVAFGVQFKQPISQSYGGGNTKARQRLSMRLSFVL